MNKRPFFLLLSLCVLFGFSACTTSDFRTGTLHIRLKAPAGKETISLDSTVITITNQSLSTTYRVTTDANGAADLSIPAGTCILSTRKTLTDGNTDYILSGGLSNIYFKGDGEEVSLDIPLHLTQKSRLLISEVYFASCKTPNGTSNYTKDCYLMLANNTTETLYLDGLCIAQLAPTTTVKPSGWVLHTDMAELPLFLMCWQFPGKGNDHPIAPGEEQTIAINAVDHTAGDAGVPASLDLSKVEWAFWNEVLTTSQITAGVKPLDLLWRSGGTAYIITTNGPTVILFRPDCDMKAWIADASHIQTEPGNTSKTLYLHIASSWLMDAVNYVSSVATQSYSRLPASFDTEPGIAGASGSGQAVRRKQTEEDGRLFWQDTNSTADDFETVAPTLKTQRP